MNILSCFYFHIICLHYFSVLHHSLYTSYNHVWVVLVCLYIVWLIIFYIKKIILVEKYKNLLFHAYKVNWISLISENLFWFLNLVLRFVISKMWSYRSKEKIRLLFVQLFFLFLKILLCAWKNAKQKNNNSVDKKLFTFGNVNPAKIFEHFILFLLPYNLFA